MFVALNNTYVADSGKLLNNLQAFHVNNYTIEQLNSILVTISWTLDITDLLL